MKTGGPTPVPSNPTIRKTPIESPSNTMEVTRNEPTPSYDAQPERSDRGRRRANPDIQDGRYGFETTEDKMEVDGDVPPSAPRETERPRDRHDLYRNEPPGNGRDFRYDQPRGGYYDRGWDRGRPRDDRRLYSDGLYSRPHGRGYR